MMKSIIHDKSESRERIGFAMDTQQKYADDLREIGVDPGPLSIPPPPFGWNGYETKEEQGSIHDRQVAELWIALAITAVVMCMMGFVLLYRTL